MTDNRHISSFVNILSSALVNFVKIRFVSHRKVHKRYVEGVLIPPPTTPAAHLALLRPLFILDKLFFVFCFLLTCLCPMLFRVLRVLQQNSCVLLRGLRVRMSPSVCSEVILGKRQQSAAEMRDKSFYAQPSQQVHLAYAQRSQVVAAVRPQFGRVI